MGAFEDAGNRLIAGAMLGMEEFAYGVMEKSLELVPVRTGTLYDSARVNPAERVGNMIQLEFGYGYGDDVNPEENRTAAEYAVPVHERLEAKHPPPKQAKFLEDPLFERMDRMGEEMSVTMQMTVGQGYSIGKMAAGGFDYVNVVRPFAGLPRLPIRDPDIGSETRPGAV